jgi:diadenosine tetraphosphate (Ap4A) HIT family hydrolase
MAGNSTGVGQIMTTSNSADCPFCTPLPGRLIDENRLAKALWDGFPVSKGHALIVPKRHIASLADTTVKERLAIWALLEKVRQLLIDKHRPDGFNIGINDGTTAGQTVMHLHVHFIPRYAGDIADPRGGVRWVLPEHADYWGSNGA